MTTYTDVWAFTENAPKYAESTSDLWHWSTNCDPGPSPFTLFLDLIGWSKEHFGEPIYDMRQASLGYVELSKLADALNEYTDRPTDVMAWVDELLEFDEA